MLRLRRLPGVTRPAIAILFPSGNPQGFNVLLDAGATADSRDSFNGTGLIRAAADRTERFASRYDAIFLHGAYEWTGVALDLIRALDRAAGVTACRALRRRRRPGGSRSTWRPARPAPLRWSCRG